jgi:Tfp pilus assembly protein PilZ
VEPAQLAKTARASLANALSALQSSDDAPDELLEAAEPIAQTMGILHKIERSGGAVLDGRDIALKNVRKVLADVQALDAAHPAVDTVLEAVAGCLAKVNALAKYKPTGQAAPPPAAQPVAETKPAPQPAAQPVAEQKIAPQPAAQPVAEQKIAPQPAPQPVAEPKIAPQPAPQPVAEPKPAPQPAPQPAVEAKPVLQPVVDIKPTPLVEPRPVLELRPDPAPAPAPQPTPAPQPVIEPKAVVAARAEPAPAPAKPAPTPAPAAAKRAQQTPAPAATKPAQQTPAPTTAKSATPAPAPARAKEPPPPAGTRTVDVELGTHSASNFYKGLGGNDVIEHGGIFVATYRIPKLGSLVQLRVLLPGDYEFYATATVQWMREASGSSEPGFGARFTQIGNEGRQLVYRYARNREPMFYDDL